MTTPAVRDNQSPLEAVLVDVRAALADLLVAADEQYAAIAARDHHRLENVTRQQERLSGQLARAEARRIELLAGTPITEAVATLPPIQAARAEALRQGIAAAVIELKQRHARTSRLLERSVMLGKQTLDFLQRLVTSPNPVYNPRGLTAPRQSVLVELRA